MPDFVKAEGGGVWCSGCSVGPSNEPCKISYCLDFAFAESPDSGEGDR